VTVPWLEAMLTFPPFKMQKNDIHELQTYAGGLPDHAAARI